MNVGFDHRAVGAQLAPASQLEFTGKSAQPPVEQPQRFRLNQISPPQQCLVAADAVKVDPAEPTQNQAIVYESNRVLVAPIVQVLDR